jgi:hypothetical protein
VTHRFMGAAEIDTELGRERLQACVFRVPVDGEMVSMCQVNAGDMRQRLTQRRTHELARRRSQAGSQPAGSAHREAALAPGLVVQAPVIGDDPDLVTGSLGAI